MAEIRVQGPDGSTFAFPEGTKFDTIQSAMSSHYGTPKTPEPAKPETGNATDMVKAGYLGALDGASFSFGDELGAALGTVSEGLASYLPGQPEGRSYSEIKDAIRKQNEDAQKKAPGSFMMGQIGGGLATGVGLAAGGLSAGVNAARAGGSLGRVALASATDGAVMGGVSGAGAGEGLQDRTLGAGLGFFGGGLLGGAAPVAVAGLAGAAKPFVAPLISRLRPDAYADAAIGEGVRRTGRTVDDLTAMLTSAQQDGQGMFNVADAMGKTGRRMLSTVAKTPNDARQAVFEALEGRQIGQGERLSNFLAEGFDAPDTAAARTASLTDARTQEANQLYGAARQSAGAVDITPVLREIDATLSPGASGIARPQDRMANDTIEGALARVRSMISDGRSNLTDFNSIFRVKLDLDDMIQKSEGQGAGNRAHALARVQRELDSALAAASPEYATARDAFSTASRRIDAVGEGTAASSGRRRAADTIPQFQSMTPEEQSAFRAGYVDPLIAKTESNSIAPTTNKARPLRTEKYGQEMEEFAAPGQGELLNRRIGREQDMFDTARTALSGSETSENLADAADMARFDPGVIKTLIREGPVAGAMAAVGRALTEAQGLPPSVVERIAKTLMETDPAAARRVLSQGVNKTTKDDVVRGLASLLATSVGSSSTGRLAKP